MFGDNSSRLDWMTYRIKYDNRKNFQLKVLVTLLCNSLPSWVAEAPSLNYGRPM